MTSARTQANRIGFFSDMDLTVLSLIYYLKYNEPSHVPEYNTRL